LKVLELMMALSKGLGMTTLARPISVRFDDSSMWVELDDGRTLGVPLAWFPRLLHGSAAGLIF
jgi:hypothetical protein